MAAPRSSLRMLMTNSPDPPSLGGRTLRSVSFGDPSAFGAVIEKESAIGVSLATLKYENGATFNRPSGDMVETTAMGLGTTRPVSSRARSGSVSVRGSTSTQSPLLVVTAGPKREDHRPANSEAGTGPL